MRAVAEPHQRLIRVLLRGGAAPLVLLLAGGCGLPSKPQRLAFLEELHRRKPYAEARQHALEAMRSSAAARERAEQAWRDRDLALASHWAEVGILRARTALVLADEKRASQRLQALQREVAHLTQRRVHLAGAIEETGEKIQLYEELALASVTTKEKELELVDFHQQLEAQKKVDQALVALKLAETVRAAEHAPRLLELGRLALARAIEALKDDHYGRAIRVAGLAQRKAEAAYGRARPAFLEERQADERRARSEALQADAAKIDVGAAIRLETVGETQQLRLPVVGLFDAGSNTLRRQRLETLNAIARLLGKYPECPVLINGYTSTRVPRGRRYAVSLARARQVASYLLTLGLPFERLAVSGRGAEEPIGRAAAVNDRVEIVLLFQ